MGVTERVARSRELVAEGRCPSVVARVAGISRQALYLRAKRPLSEADQVILDVVDGTRMVAALAGRELGRAVNRKKARRLMTEHRLLQRRRPSGGRRKRPGFFRVERPDQLWHMDMTPIWTAEHGWGLQVRCDPFRRGWCSLGRQAASARSRSVRRARQMLVHVGVGRLLDASDLLIAVPRGQPGEIPALAVRQRGQRAQRPPRLQRILEFGRPVPRGRPAPRRAR